MVARKEYEASAKAIEEAKEKLLDGTTGWGGTAGMAIMVLMYMAQALWAIALEMERDNNRKSSGASSTLY
jgi:hypothetical protein